MVLLEGEIQKRLKKFLSTITIINYSEVEEFHKENAYSIFKPRVVDLVDKLKKINVTNVSNLLIEEPETIFVFEKLLRETRFSNAQLAYFCFNLNNINYGKISSSAKIFDSHLKLNTLFQQKVHQMSKGIEKIGIRNFEKLTIEQKSIILRSIIYKISQNSEYLFSLLNNPKFSNETGNRVAKYMIEKLRLKEIIDGLNVTNHLKSKRAFRDTKGMHGEWAKNKLIKVLEKKKLPRGDDKKYKLSFLPEANIPGIMRPKYKKKRKKLDLVIYKRGLPKYAIETNYYTTSGTKIGINVGEYIDILRFIKKQKDELNFIWVTDGTGWLDSSNIDTLRDTLIPEFGNNLMNIFQFGKWVKKWI